MPSARPYRVAAILGAVLACFMPAVASVASASEDHRGHVPKKAFVVGACAGASPYTTVQQATEAAMNTRRGAKVLVCPGTYAESVLLTGQTDIVLKPYPGAGAEPVLAGADDEPYVITTSGSGEYTVRGLRIEGRRGGLEVDSTQAMRVLDNEIDVGEIGIWAHGYRGPDVVGNDIRSGQIGIVAENTIAYIDQNTISADDIGVAVWDAPVNLQSTVITGAGEAALSLLRANGGFVHRVQLNDSAIGIEFDSSEEVSIWRTRALRNSDAGIRIDDDSGDNWIHDSTFTGNGIDAVDGTTVRDGHGTAGTLNTWESVTCGTSDPVGLCSGS